MKFKEFEKHLKGIPYTASDEWTIDLPHGTKQEVIQKVIDICKDLLIIDWHIIYPEPTEFCPEPRITIYWDRNDLTSPTE